MTDTARSIHADPRAPADERFDATSELTKAHMPTSAADLLPQEPILKMIEFMQDSYAVQQDQFGKALASNIVPFPSKNAKAGRDGMQSVYLDDVQHSVMGDYYEKPGIFAFDSMRAMVGNTPILSSVILTRQRQVQRFCRVQENGRGPGFDIRLRDSNQHVGDAEKVSIQVLQDFFTHCGFEKNPRQRARLRRDDFSTLMAKLVGDSLTLDSAPIETEFKRDRRQGIDGLYAVDGATIRLCNEQGYNGDDEIRALQVVQGRVRSAYTFDDLIYVPRNPRTDVMVGGYGFSETELLIKVVTGMLNAMTYNNKFFDSNSMPKGLLHLSGSFGEQDLSAFKRQWNAMVRGINNSWALPVMVSKDQESSAKFEQFGNPVDEMMFGKWITFLTSIICAVYGIDPAEINFESFKTTAGGLAGNDTEEKITSSKDKGLRPLLSYFENLFSDFIVADFSDKYCFRFTGLDEEDEKQVFERNKLTMTVNEMRAEDNRTKITESWGEAPLNPSLISAWQAGQQQDGQDFGQPAAANSGTGAGADAASGSQQDFGSDDQQDFGDEPAAGGDDEPPEAAVPADDMAKAFNLPVYQVET